MRPLVVAATVALVAHHVAYTFAFMAPMRLPGSRLALPHSFTPSTHGRAMVLPSVQASTAFRPRADLLMLVEPTGTDAFKRIAAGTADHNLLHRLSSNQAKVIRLVSIPVAIVGSFIGVPKANLLAKAAVGAVAGMATKMANDKVRATRQAGAEAAVAQLLLEAEDDMDAVTPMVLKTVTARYDVEYAQHLRIMKNLYTQYLLAILVWPDVRMFEPKALVDLSAALGLDGSSVGDAHCDAAYELISRQQDVPEDQRDEEWDNKIKDKLLFLSSRLYSQLEEEETREYEMGRVEQILGLTPEERKERIQGLVLPFYTNVVMSGVTQLRQAKSVSSEEDEVADEDSPRALTSRNIDGSKLLQWRRSLGLSEVDTSRVHSKVFLDEVKRCVKESGDKLTDGQVELLSKVRGLLSITSFEAERSRETVTSPLLRKVIMDTFVALPTTEAKEWKEMMARIRTRQRELQMVDGAVMFHMKDVFRERLRKLLRETFAVVAPGGKIQPLEAGQEGTLHKAVSASLLMMDLTHDFLDTNGLLDRVDEDIFDLEFVGSTGEFTLRQREALYQGYVESLLKLELVTSQGDNMKRFAAYLKLPGDFVKGTLRRLLGPIYESKAKQFLSTNTLTDEKTRELKQIMVDYHVSEEDVKDIGLQLYEARAQKHFNKGFTSEQLADLAKVRSFLMLTEYDTEGVHEKLGREVYMEAVKTALEKKQLSMCEAVAKKLGLSESTAGDLMAEGMSGMVAPMMEALKTTYRRIVNPHELARSSGVDEGDDPFIRGRPKDGLMIKTDRNSNVMVEAVAIVKFLEDCGAFRETEMNLDDKSHMVKKTAGVPFRTVKSFICRASTPIFSGDAGDRNMAEEIYKGFVKTVAIAPEGEKKEKYRTIQDKFGASLGISPPRMETIKFDLFFDQLQAIVRGSLEEKGLVGADENIALMKLSKSWGIAEDRAKRLIQAEKSSWFAVTLVDVIQTPPADPGLAIYRLRRSAQSLGIDIGEDVPELTVGNREFLFRNELRYHLSEFSDEADGETVADMVEQYALKELLVKIIMEEEFVRATRQSAVDLVGNMARGDIDGALNDLEVLLRVGAILPLPLSFKEEPFLAVKVMTEVVRVWAGVGVALGKREESSLMDAPYLGEMLDLRELLKTHPAEKVKELEEKFEEKEEVVLTLIAGLGGVSEDGKTPKSDKYVNFLGKRVGRKFVDTDKKAKTNKDWKKFEEKTHDGLKPGTMNEPGREKKDLKQARIVAKVLKEVEAKGKLAAPWPLDDRRLPVVPQDGTFEIPPSDRQALLQWMQEKSEQRSLANRKLMQELAELEDKNRR